MVVTPNCEPRSSPRFECPEPIVDFQFLAGLPSGMVLHCRLSSEGRQRRKKIQKRAFGPQKTIKEKSHASVPLRRQCHEISPLSFLVKQLFLAQSDRPRICRVISTFVIDSVTWKSSRLQGNAFIQGTVIVMQVDNSQLAENLNRTNGCRTNISGIDRTGAHKIHTLCTEYCRSDKINGNFTSLHGLLSGQTLAARGREKTRER